MMVSLYLLLGVGATAAARMPTDDLGNSNVSVALPDGYTAIPFSMRGAIEPGGDVMTFTGTVTDIFAQIQGIKPDFTWDDFESTIPLTGAPHEKILCSIPGQTPGLRMVLLWGYDYLKTINQPCQVASGPRKCAMLFCRGNPYKTASIWMCNDNTTPISRTCEEMADYVIDIIGDENCIVDDSKMLSQGQEFDTDGFNIIVRGGGCD
ncbi:hypothetical protein F5Y04DRAFT_284779 [Hypomontagnella monticulosa]|nr:hypothetical protein F5Y04DRAFT_284779 [Hypomontagnella monticulosa]